MLSKQVWCLLSACKASHLCSQCLLQETVGEAPWHHAACLSNLIPASICTKCVHAAPPQVSVTLSGYTLAAPFTPAAANFSAPVFFGVGAPLRDHLLHWRVRPALQAPRRRTHARPCTALRALQSLATTWVCWPLCAYSTRALRWNHGHVSALASAALA